LSQAVAISRAMPASPAAAHLNVWAAEERVDGLDVMTSPAWASLEWFAASAALPFALQIP